MSSDEEMTQVVVRTSNHVIRGAVALIPGARLTDYLRNADLFIAVVDAVVEDQNGKELFRRRFVNVHRDQIEIVALGREEAVLADLDPAATALEDAQE
ncbi:MAG: hypothetical protein DRI90_24600 [Deltaproteobacteria bacterium]|nr:MAG: hypothetical protein DRI90_24600 [Deltaproteobacteria bacterium]